MDQQPNIGLLLHVASASKIAVIDFRRQGTERAETECRTQ